MAKTNYFLLLTSLAFFVGAAHAAKVSKVDGRKILFELDGDNVKEGDVFVLLDEGGKKKGLVKVKGIRGTKAVGLLGKGKAQVGWIARVSDKVKVAKPSGPRKAREAAKPTESGEQRGHWGIAAGMSMNTMSVDIDNDADQTADETVSLDGTSFSVKGIFDYLLIPQMWFRGMFGLQGLSASGKTAVGCQNEACSVSIYYLSADFWGRYIFSSGSFRPWVGGGFSLMFPMSKDVTALEDSSITNTSVISIGGGFDWQASPTMYIPIQLEYGMLPKSETVEASAITLRVGLMFPF